MKKRIFAVVMTLLVTVMCFAGCGADTSLVGKWKCEMDYTDEMNEGFAQGLGLSGQEMADYIVFTDFVLTIDLEFTQDGWRYMSIDLDSLKEQADKSKAIIENGLRAYLIDALISGGYEASDLDAYLEETGIDPAAVAEEAMGEAFIQAQKAAFTDSSKYSVSDGKLFTFAEDEIANPDLYESFTLEGDVLTFTSASDGTAGYPITFKKVTE